MTETSPDTQSARTGGDSSGRLRRGILGLAGAARASTFGFGAVGSVLLWVVAPLVVGVWLAQTLVPPPAVGIIRLNTDIYAESTDFVMAQIQEARRDPGIRAVVLELDSPGGEVSASQALYLEVQALRREMPVVGSVQSMAASGAYYVAMGTDPIYAKPSSTVGNVGCWGFIPPDIGVNDVVLASGPFKLTATNRDEFLRWIEEIRQEFVETVYSQRGDRIELSRVELSYGLAYSGRDAVRLGVIDGLGSETDATRMAAQQAGISHYQVIDLEARVLEELPEVEAGELEPWVGAADPVTGRRTLPPGAYLLYDIQLGGAP